MNDITNKINTLRYAKAEGFIKCTKDTLERVKKNDLPKKDMFGMALASSLLGAKRTSDIIPHCHPVKLDYLDVNFEIEEDGIRIVVEAKSVDRTGIEMEALTAVSIGALTIFDHLKAITKDISIEGIRVLEKKGGASENKKESPPSPSKAAVLVCSDTCHSGKKEDRSGKAIQSLLESKNIIVSDYKIVPDDPEPISSFINEKVKEGYDLVIATGGTGIGSRDITTDTIKGMIEQEIPGIAEAMRAFGQERTPYSMLSRSFAGRIGKSIIIAVPGSTNGAVESLTAIISGLGHAKKMMRGSRHE
jgi:molybdenum cofactor biosynthesis protein MoaC